MPPVFVWRNNLLKKPFCATVVLELMRSRKRRISGWKITSSATTPTPSTCPKMKESNFIPSAREAIQMT